MAEGDMCSGILSISDESYTIIKPSTIGVEWIIHNIYIPIGTALEIYYTNGTTDVKICKTTASLCGYFFHCNVVDTYLKIVNVSGSNTYIGYDGVQTSE